MILQRFSPTQKSQKIKDAIFPNQKNFHLKKSPWAGICSELKLGARKEPVSDDLDTLRIETKYLQCFLQSLMSLRHLNERQKNFANFDIQRFLSVVWNNFLLI